MTSKILFLLLILFSLFLPKAKADGDNFQTYANTQSQLMHDAYTRRDTKVYNQLLSQFISKYNKLKPQEQKDYSAYLTNAYYNLSCAYSLLNNKRLAVTYLDKAIKAGYNNYTHINEDTDLDNIRTDASFLAMVSALRRVGDYNYILKNAAAYNTADHRSIPAFTYQSARDSNLVALRKAFNLDSIAGKGNQVARVLNLMYWIHNLVPHDGQHMNPAVKNAMSMIRECKRDNRGLNCRGLATVLNECYLSLGIPSRFITCLPKDSLGVDPDCHVINMVYIKDLKKWIWIDPTNAAYVRNEKGELLGLSEVRERLISGQPLLLNPEANWNNRESQTKASYLDYYMTKNLYRLETPVSSEFDTETFKPGKQIEYVQLMPLEYFKQSSNNKSASTDNQTQVTFVHYTTNNPEAFWAPPGK